MVNIRPFDGDAVAMPPPTKRVKSVQSTMEKEERSAAPVSPEKEHQVLSIVKRKFHTSSPTEATDQGSAKRMKGNDESTMSPTNGSAKVDPKVFASAFALASLALSPQQAYGGAPYSQHSVQTREDDTGNVHGDHYSLREPSSPYNADASMPISPEGALAQRRRRAKFASRNKRARSIPRRMPYDRKGIPNRMMFRHGPVFRHPPYPEQHAFWPQESPWRAPLSMPHPMPTPPPHEKEWICDYCRVASFETYDEACAHESSCRVRCHGQSERKVNGHITHRDDPHFMALYDHHRVEDCETKVAEDNTKYFTGCVSLAVPSSDSEWLSELNCFVRQFCVEAFSANEDDISRASKRGRIALHQVGVRCKYCSRRDSKEKAVAAVSYPTTVSGIYESVKRWQRVHQSVCKDVPEHISKRLEELQNTSVWVPTTRQYWADSARALGMTDTHSGIRFDRPPSAPEGWVPENHTESSAAVSNSDDAGKEAGYIALPCDKEEIPEYVYFLMRQVESCRFTEADRFVARSKGPVGFAGFQCRHCSGHAGLGKYFPLTAKSLATNSTSQNIHAHLLKCRKCSPQVKETLVRLKNEKGKAPRLVPGWRREFFDRVWERLHGENAKHQII